MNEFKGKRAVVTGGAGGIGSAVAQALLAEGCEVTATGWGVRELEARRADPAFKPIRIVELDVRDRDAIEAFARDFSGLDILVNCAGALLRGPEAFEEEGFQRMLEINLSGTMRTCRAFLPKLETSGGGAIVNIASMMSFFGSGASPGYAASKGAVAQLTKSLAIAWAPKNIRVNAVAPGWIETPMSAHVKRDLPDMYQRVAERTPMKRWGEPKHIADAAAFLCSSKAAFITGVILPVDGGYMIA